MLSYFKPVWPPLSSPILYPFGEATKGFNKCYWKRLFISTILVGFFAVTPALAQSPASSFTSEKLLNKRIEFFSQQMGISIQEAKKAITIMDKATEDLNRIYSDTSISSMEKIKRLSVVEKDRDLKMNALIPDFEVRHRGSLESKRNNFKKNQ